MKTVAFMLKVIHTRESKEVVREKTIQVAEKLRAMKCTKAFKKEEDGIEETLIYMDFPTVKLNAVQKQSALFLTARAP